MNLKDFDLVKLSKLTSQQTDQITCLACCKFYIAPQTAACGHTLCHTCWRERRTCPCCAKPFERRNLRLNHPIQNLTEHIYVLGEAFEKLFNIKLDEFLLDTGERDSENDPTKNVKDWLASSQNHFSAPLLSSEQSCPEIQQPSNFINVSSNKIQIHTSTSKIRSPVKVVHVPIPQDDWDKIEPMPDTEDVNKNKENVVGPMDIEPFDFYDVEYSARHPRRSSRKRELKPTVTNNKTNENISLEKQSCKDSSGEIDKNSNKTKQTWNNVKRMRKEFSKLNKINKNKLNVSIEMCKKAHSTTKTNSTALPQIPSSHVYDIDENTPQHFNVERQIMEEVRTHNINDKENDHHKDNTSRVPETNIGVNNENHVHSNATNEYNKSDSFQNLKIIKATNQDSQETNAETVHSSEHIKANAHNAVEGAVRMPFYKRSTLYPKGVELNPIQTINHNVDTNTSTTNDDIEITIKVGNTITNIIIKKKNDVELNVKTDREIQTSLTPHDVVVKNNAPSSQSMRTQNIVINVGDNNNVDVENQSKTNPRIEELKKVDGSVKTVSGKKNTDSADTGTAQYEITESVEKELSKVMDCVEVDEPIQSKSNPDVEEKSSQPNNISQKPETNQDDHEYLNDLDIFDSESVKESDVHLLKNTEPAPSEILLCTVKMKNKTQKYTEKRNRDANDEDTLPQTKKSKLDNEVITVAIETIQPNKSKENQPESEPMNYDAIMGTVFASIDADIEEIRHSQNIDKNKSNDDKNENEHHNCKETPDDKATQEEVALSGINEIGNTINPTHEYCNQKHSENVFSVCVEKENEVFDAAPTNDKVLPNQLPTDVDEFLTPVIRNNLESTRDALVVDNSIEMVNDDSESVVEETPQKSTSFTITKLKCNGANKDVNQSQRVDLSEQKMPSDKKSTESGKIKTIVNITDTSLEVNSKKDVTVIETLDKKSLETPLTINKFADQIKYKSTPVARKSLNFDTENMDDLDPEQTSCPTTDAVVKTTQEKEFLLKAFEKTPTTPVVRSLGLRNLGLRFKRACIAGSCLTSAEITKVKLLCTRYKWTYTDKFSKDLTHLVVGVDEENRSQRSVKYMCALASSKWIVSFEWVDKCLQSKDVVSEEYFEALDSTGEPGPMRSRVATRKLFQGIMFYCMEPFSVLDVDTLKSMLEAAGGRVVKEVKEVRVNDKSSVPAILLAEPENTQEDRFIYLAMELSIVPVNYEWVLNCLGNYSIGSIQELLLCPASLLPKATINWPQELLARDED